MERYLLYMVFLVCARLYFIAAYVITSFPCCCSPTFIFSLHKFGLEHQLLVHGCLMRYISALELPVTLHSREAKTLAFFEVQFFSLF